MKRKDRVAEIETGKKAIVPSITGKRVIAQGHPCRMTGFCSCHYYSGCTRYYPFKVVLIVGSFYGDSSGTPLFALFFQRRD